jgi:hypothetical protein
MVRIIKVRQRKSFCSIAPDGNAERAGSQRQCAASWTARTHTLYDPFRYPSRRSTGARDPAFWDTCEGRYERASAMA